MAQPTPQLSFGTYTFPLTFQETSRTTSLAFDKKKIPFNYGENVSFNTNVGARQIDISGPIGSLVAGSGGNTLLTASDLEAERRILAGLQLNGPQTLYVGTEQYAIAYLETFQQSFWQDAFGFRIADWKLKFYCSDPRYVVPTATVFNSPTLTAPAGVSSNTTPVATAGNIRTYPTLTFNASGAGSVGPYVSIKNGSGLSLGVTFSNLTMAAGSTLVINCDPRPDNRSGAALYTPSGAASQNALQYSNITTDFPNTYDLAEWFPFISPNDATLILTYGFNNGTGGAYTFSANWHDRYL